MSFVCVFSNPPGLMNCFRTGDFPIICEFWQVVGERLVREGEFDLNREDSVLSC